ncbi:DoxX family membrane protein, partial [Rhizobium ruizarguesonis]
MARAIAIIVARIIFSLVFFMAAGFKFADIGATAGHITAAGFPMATFLAWVAAFFEIALALAFISWAFFTEASLLAGIDVIFLAFAFHGPSHWQQNQ